MPEYANSVTSQTVFSASSMNFHQSNLCISAHSMQVDNTDE